MRKTKKELWIAIRDYNFADIVPNPVWDRLKAMIGNQSTSLRAFIKKIAGKNNWSEKFAREAIDEYRKFVFLAMTSNTDVTPSKVIDRVWRQHVLFTKGYRLFCQEVLDGVYLDRNPALVNDPKEVGVFSAQYMRTLERYKEEFGDEPPSHIWDVPKFKKDKVRPTEYEPYRRSSDVYITGSSDEPLHSIFPTYNDMKMTIESEGAMQPGGGEYGGGGAGSSWSGSPDPSPTPSDPPSSNDSGGSSYSSPDSGGGSYFDGGGSSSSCDGGGCDSGGGSDGGGGGD